MTRVDRMDTVRPGWLLRRAVDALIFAAAIVLALPLIVPFS